MNGTSFVEFDQEVHSPKRYLIHLSLYQYGEDWGIARKKVILSTLIRLEKFCCFSWSIIALYILPFYLF